MSEETKVSNETVVEGGAEDQVQENAHTELIAESKKYRKRAQDAESQLAEIQKKLQDQENAKLKEKEEFKTLAEKLEAENSDLKVFKDSYEKLIDQRKADLLNQLPEEKREQFKDKELDVIEFMVSELQSKQPVDPQVRGTVKSKSKNIADMTGEERKANWGTIINSYIKK